MKRNTIVLGVTLLLLAVFAWAGWANWEYRKQAAQHRADAATLKAALASAANPEEAYTQSPLLGKQAPSFTLQDLAGKQISLADYKGKAHPHQLLGHLVRPLQAGNSLARRARKAIRPPGL